MDESDIASRLREIAERLDFIERHLGIGPAEAKAEVRPPSEDAAVREEIATPEGVPAARPEIAIALPGEPPAPPPEPVPPPPRVVATLIGRPTPPPRAPSPLVQAESRDESRAAAKPRRTGTPLEILIGERWMAWVGAAVVVLAVGFFVKLAYDLGWWGRLPPIAKVLGAAGFGAALVVCGEVALRRVGRIAAVSLFGAGLGTLYLTAYATFRFFELLSQTGAFWLMLLVAILGFGITLRGRLVAIGVLALLGGYLSPILLSEQVTFAAAFPMYVTALLAVGLGLSAARAAEFRVLRYVAVAFHAGAVSLWLVREGSAHWLLAMSFLTVWWALVLAEALLAAFRGQSARGNPVVVLFFTIWYVAFGCDILALAEPGQRNWLGLFTCATAAVCAWLALPFGPGLAVLRIRPRRALERLAATLWAQVGILLATAIGLQFREHGQSFGQSIGWLVMAVACVEIGRRLPSRGVDVFGLLVGALGLVRVWACDHELPLLRTVWWSSPHISINYWSLLALGAIGVTQAIARRLRLPGTFPWGRLCAALTLLSALQWVVLSAIACDALAITTAWLVAVVALLAAAPIGQSPAYRSTAVLVLLLTAAKWLTVDVGWPGIVGAGAAAALPFFNWQMGIAAAICACIWWVFRTRRLSLTAGGTDDAAGAAPAPWEEASWAQLLLGGGVCFLLVALSIEIARAVARSAGGQPSGLASLWDPLQVREFWWTLLWAVGGLMSLWCGWRRALFTLFSGGVIVVTACGLTWMLGDTLYWRMARGVALCPVILNPEFGVGIGVAVIAATAMWIVAGPRSSRPDRADEHKTVVVLGTGLVAAIGLWLGSLELDRFFAPEAARVADPAMARQTALSVYWGVYAIMLVALGFWKQSAPVRYGGLALLAITLGKVMIVDLAHVQYVYRVLSLLATGLLFIVTSIAYAKLASRLRAR